MKQVKYSFSDTDIDTCIFSLSLLPILHDDEDITELQIDINEQCAISATDKLCSHKPLTPNELRVLCCCITLGVLICQGEFDVDDQIYKNCMQHVFTLNKLDKQLVSQVLDS